MVQLSITHTATIANDKEFRIWCGISLVGDELQDKNSRPEMARKLGLAQPFAWTPARFYSVSVPLFLALPFCQGKESSRKWSLFPNTAKLNLLTISPLILTIKSKRKPHLRHRGNAPHLPDETESSRLSRSALFGKTSRMNGGFIWKPCKSIPPYS